MIPKQREVHTVVRDQKGIMAQGCPQLIGLDWGTSSLRAYLFDSTGNVLEAKASPWGVMSTAGSDFAEAYHAMVAQWRARDPLIPAIAAGMVGSTEGWVRAPYLACPAGVGELARALVAIVTSTDGIVHVVPGVEVRGSAPDVMRGEETQIAGALALQPELAAGATLVLPGTHAKWVAVRDAFIVGFATYMTGELYALLSEHSILGRPARTSGVDVRRRAMSDEAFDRGVETVRTSATQGIAPLLFRCRSLVLAQTLEAAESLDFLSGLLIGDEVRSALATAAPKLALIGERALCERYRRALHAFGVPDAPIIDGGGPAGLWRIACRAGLVPARLSHV